MVIEPKYILATDAIVNRYRLRSLYSAKDKVSVVLVS